MKIEIQWLSDEHECEQCGYDYASGAIVDFEDGTSLSLIPIAHCYAGRNWGEADVYHEVLKHLGHEVSQ